MNYELAVKNIRTELRTYIQENKIKSLVIGISGGLDSCVCAVLARPVCDELGIPLIGRSLPITTNTDDEMSRAKSTGKFFCTDFEEVNLEPAYSALSGINYNTDPVYEMIGNSMDLTKESEEQNKKWKIRNGNIKARLRMIYLYNLASMNDGMVLNTDNYTEHLLGFSTLHGDVGDFGMLQNLWKSEVYDMAEWLVENEHDEKSIHESSVRNNVITSTIEAMATDGLGVTNHGDLGQILPDWKGSSREGYKEVDRILQLSFKETVLHPIKELHNHPVFIRHLATQFKRNNPFNIQRNLIIE